MGKVTEIMPVGDLSNLIENIYKGMLQELAVNVDIDARVYTQFAKEVECRDVSPSDSAFLLSVVRRRLTTMLVEASYNTLKGEVV